FSVYGEEKSSNCILRISLCRLFMDSSRGKNCESGDAELLPAEPPVSAEKDQIVPLSGNPFLTFVVSWSHVHDPYQVLLPKRFYPFLPSACVPVTLSYGNRTWMMKYSCKGILRRLCCGWKNFAVDTDLKVGDGCVLELMDSNNLLFKVQILRHGDVPGKSDKGVSCDAPISIDD
ncbi:unnamed protein product, partial [Musa textilis]